MTEVQEKKLKRLEALAFEWERSPQLKEMCRRTGDPEFFIDCEMRISKLKEVSAVERKHHQKNWSVKFLDISEINVEGW